ncbi:hypothetical protein DVH24_018044 [Malus domestica]|uniref:Acid phosphatase n=1 Tax=Malus domestica TaxID=3750 RepID=A0A498KK55_MALDO|nr:hypothetical protein DVH24_018044 [Malus domestica]
MASVRHRLLLLITLLAIPASLSSQSVIQMPRKRHRFAASDDSLYCDSWRFSIDLVQHSVQDYMTGDRYRSDLASVANYSLSFAKGVTIGGDGKDAWVFDIDETLLSNLAYYQAHGFGSETFNEAFFDEWVDLAEAPALPASLNLYKELEQLGFKMFLLTGRSEHQRNATARNLLYAGYNNWERLLLRGPSDQGTPATVYKSQKRSDLINEGYRIHGSSGDQWSDLIGFAIAQRSFKLPNPMYYIA